MNESMQLNESVRDEDHLLPLFCLSTLFLCVHCLAMHGMHALHGPSCRTVPVLARKVTRMGGRRACTGCRGPAKHACTRPTGISVAACVHFAPNSLNWSKPELRIGYLDFHVILRHLVTMSYIATCHHVMCMILTVY